MGEQTPDLPAQSQAASEPATRPERLCNNCSAVLQGPYCHRCGQPARSFIRALPGLIGEVASETLYYDSRMWRTLKSLLLQPGQLSTEYVSGKRARYTPPVRLYLVTSIIAFLVVTLVIATADINPWSADEMDVSVTEDSALFQWNGQPWHPEDHPAQVGWLGERGNDWLNRQLDQLHRNTNEAVRNPARLVTVAAGMLPQAMFIILPLFSAWVTVFYLFARRYYIEHLLLQVHNHAFLFLSLVVLYLLALVRDVIDSASFWGQGTLSGLLVFVSVIIWCWIPVYVLISIKRFYQQGWLLTLSKYLILGASYIIMLQFALVAIIVLGLWRI